MLALVRANKKKLIAAALAAAYVGLGLATGDLDWSTAATKFVALVGLGAL